MLTSVNGAPESCDSCYLCCVKRRKSSLLLLLAILTVVAVAAYEYYWVRGLYRSRLEAAEHEIKVSFTWAEMEEVLLRRNHSTRILPNILVTRVEMPVIREEQAESRRMDLKVMDSLLCVRLDSVGLPTTHRIELVLEGNVVDSACTPDYVRAADEMHISGVALTSTGATFEFYSRPLGGYVLRQMSGVLLLSGGMLLILVLVFCLLMRALRKQRELDEMKSDFTSNMTHELKTPIAVAYAANDAMLVYGLDKDPVKREEYLKVTRESLEKLNGMVEQILSMSMENREKLALRIERTELRPLLESVAAQTRLSAGKPCDLTVVVEPADLSADIDAALMSSVVSTLLDNAVKYSGESAEIRLAAEAREGHVRIAVRDKGIGIALDKQARIFEKFYRVPAGDVHDVKGYGIGLFFARTIVEKHGGHISVHSEPGKGSTFTIEL